MHATLVLHGVTGITWGKEHKLADKSYTRELVFKSPNGEARVEIYAEKPISISQGTIPSHEFHNVD